MSSTEAGGTLTDVLWRVDGLLAGSSIVALGHVALWKRQTVFWCLVRPTSPSPAPARAARILVMTGYRELKLWVWIAPMRTRGSFWLHSHLKKRHHTVAFSLKYHAEDFPLEQNGLYILTTPVFIYYFDIYLHIKPSTQNNIPPLPHFQSFKGWKHGCNLSEGGLIMLRRLRQWGWKCAQRLVRQEYFK